MEDLLLADVRAIGRIDAVPLILNLVCSATHMRFAAVARVTHDRWVCCASQDAIGFGLKPGGELQIGTTICNEIRQSAQEVVIDHVAQSVAYCGHPSPALHGFQSYISMPIFRRNGEFFGTLCAIDPLPAKVETPEIIGMFRLFADLIAFHLDAIERTEQVEAALLDAKETAVLRDQFIAVLGHDLRNPLNSVQVAAALIGRAPDRAIELLPLIQRSIARMAELIENLTDFARGRLGGGMTLQSRANAQLQSELQHVVQELQATHPSQPIHFEHDMSEEVSCDSNRVAQLLSNLVANAQRHGSPDQPISVRAVTRGGQFELSVANAGEPIPPAVMTRLFQPYYRASADSSSQGLGLGLYIADAIAKAHGGSMHVHSNAQETRFTMRTPLDGRPKRTATAS